MTTIYPIQYGRTGAEPDNAMWGVPDPDTDTAEPKTAGCFRYLDACPNCGHPLPMALAVQTCARLDCQGLDVVESTPLGNYIQFLPCMCAWCPPQQTVLYLERAWRLGPDGTGVTPMPGYLPYLRPVGTGEYFGGLVVAEIADGGAGGTFVPHVYPHANMPARKISGVVPIDLTPSSPLSEAEPPPPPRRPLWRRFFTALSDAST